MTADADRDYAVAPAAGRKYLMRGVALLALSVGIVAILVWWSSDFDLWIRIVGILVLAVVPAVKGLGQLSSGIGLKSAGGGLALGVSHAGLTTPGTGLVPWEGIEKIVVYSGPQSRSWRGQIASSMSNTGDLRLVVTRKAGNGQPEAELARSFACALENDLDGGRAAFDDLARRTFAHAQARAIPMAVLAAGRPWIAQELGIPAQR